MKQWRSDEANRVLAAKEICVRCDVQVPCLDEAIRSAEDEGIWGGVGGDRRHALRVVFNSGDPLAYERALGREVEETARVAGLIPDERTPTAARKCSRCDGVVAAGVHPVDRNGAKATCGKASTYNRGCRCWPCVWAKAKLKFEK